MLELMALQDRSGKEGGPRVSLTTTEGVKRMEEISISITCPVCQKEFQKKAREMPDGTVIKCPGCGEKTTIQGDMFTNMAKSVDN